jgi:hypothetical protein
MEEMGDYGPESPREWSADDYMSYLYEIQPEIDFEDIPYEATVEYVKTQFPEVAKEVDELFSEGGPRINSPVLEAFENLLNSHVDLASGSWDIMDGDEGTFRISDVKNEDGTQYRWWQWGNNLDPIDIEIDAKGQDRDDKTWTAEEIFQNLSGGKASRFKVPKGRGYDLY